MGKTIGRGNECSDALASVRQGCPTGTSEEAASQQTEPPLHLGEPGAPSGRGDEAQAMTRVRKQGRPRFHRGQRAAFACAPQILRDAARLSHQTDQRFRWMRVPVIGDKEPGRLWIGLDALGTVGSNVGFGVCRSQARAEYVTSGRIQSGEQTQGGMPLVCEFQPLHMTGHHRQPGVQMLPCWAPCAARTGVASETSHTGHICSANAVGSSGGVSQDRVR